MWKHDTSRKHAQHASFHLYVTYVQTLKQYVTGRLEDRRHQRLLNLNHYATKKSAAQSMLDVALLMANSSQLKTVMYVGPQYRFYLPLIVLLAISITLQVLVGLLLVFIVKYDLNDRRKHAKLNRMNNAATVFVFFTVLINIFITALGFEGYAVRPSSSVAVIKVPDPVPVLPAELNYTRGL